MSIFVFVCIGNARSLARSICTQFKIIMTHKDINQVDIATNSHPDKADSSLTARTKGDLHTANTAPSFDEKTKKKRRRDPNKHYITGMFCIQHTHTQPSKPLCHKCCTDNIFEIKIDFAENALFPLHNIIIILIPVSFVT